MLTWCCEELRLAYRRVDAGRHFGVVNSPEYLRLNPNGLVRTLDDDGFVVWESGSILRYLSARYSAGDLWPGDPRSRADADRWVDWTNSTFWPSLLPIFRAFYRDAEETRDATLFIKRFRKRQGWHPSSICIWPPIISSEAIGSPSATSRSDALRGLGLRCLSPANHSMRSSDGSTCWPLDQRIEPW